MLWEKERKVRDAFTRIKGRRNEDSPEKESRRGSGRAVEGREDASVSLVDENQEKILGRTHLIVSRADKTDSAGFVSWPTSSSEDLEYVRKERSQLGVESQRNKDERTNL